MAFRYMQVSGLRIIIIIIIILYVLLYIFLLLYPDLCGEKVDMMVQV